MSIDEQDVDVGYPSIEEDDENDYLPFKMEHVASVVSSPMSSNSSVQEMVQSTKPTSPKASPPSPSIKEYRKSHSVSRFITLIKLCEIIGRILHNVYAIKSSVKTINKESVLSILDSSLTSWYLQLPAPLQYNPGSDETASPENLTIHILYYSILMLLHRPYLPGPNKSQDKYSSAANSLTELADILTKKDLIHHAPNPIVYAVFMAGVLHTYNATQTDPAISLPAKANLAKCLRALQEQKRTWFNAYKYHSLLAELADLKDVKLEIPRGGEGVEQDKNVIKEEGGFEGSNDGGCSCAQKKQSNIHNQQSSGGGGFVHSSWQDPYRASQQTSRSESLDSSVVSSQQQPSVLSFSSLPLSQYNSHPQETPSESIHEASSSPLFNSYQFRYLSVLPQHASMSIPDQYTSNSLVSSNNNIGGNVSNTFDSQMAVWGIPPTADLAQWQSFMSVQQLQNGPFPQGLQSIHQTGTNNSSTLQKQ